jgi:hypothetical protein
MVVATSARTLTRERQFKALIEHGFGDLNQALLSVMVYPYPDRVRHALASRLTPAPGEDGRH